MTVARALTLRRGGELVEAIPKAEGFKGEQKGKGIRPTLGAMKVARSVAQRWVSLARVEEAVEEAREALGGKE